MTRNHLLFFGVILQATFSAAPRAGFAAATGSAASGLATQTGPCLEWASPETIIRKAKGSDNWPMTWADDDTLYTAYGDGWGFEPLIKEKLSLGFAKIEGGPSELQAFNIRAPTGEQVGEGARGKKASGLLMVDGVLYLWTRNAGNSQLAWSADHARTWTWSEWKFTNSFGCPTFLNYGKNYSGARDGYVYIYSHDQDSAYEVADRLVLARVPKAQIRERRAYEFLEKLESGAGPVWTKEPSRRGAALAWPGKCYRTSVSYNAGLNRFLLVQTFPRARDARGKPDSRFHGGLAIFTATAPWGPWSPVFQTSEWDVGPGDSASFPTKWMSQDGQTMWLVFSGDDSFSIRQARWVAEP